MIGVLASVGMAVRLFLPTPVAMADNNDGSRLLCLVGADTGNPKWVYAVFRYPASGRHTGCRSYPTLTAVQIRATAWLHQHLLGLSGVIDMRELMVEYCVLVGIVFAATAWLLAGFRTLPRLAFLGALFLVLADATFADYAGSPYTETTALYGLLVFAVAAVPVTARTPRHRAAFFTAGAAAILAVGAKTPMATLAVPLAAFLGTRRIELGRLRGRKGVRVVPALCAVSLAVTALWTSGALASQGMPNETTNVANEITMVLLPLSDDPGDVAVGLGLPRSFGTYSGTNAWSPNTVLADPRFPAVAKKFTATNLGGYLVTHPVLAERVIDLGAKSDLEFRNDYIGSYAKDAGHPASAQDCRICVVTAVSRTLEFVGLPGVLLYWAGCAAGAVWLLRRSRKDTLRRGFALVSLTLVGCTVLQFVTAVFGDGIEITKHLAVSLFTATLTPLWLFAGFVAGESPLGSAAPEVRRSQEPESVGDLVAVA